MDLVVIGIAGYVLIGAIPCGYLALRFTWRNGLENLAVVKRLQYSAGAGVALSVANAAVAFAVVQMVPSREFLGTFISLGAYELFVFALMAPITDALRKKTVSMTPAIASVSKPAQAPLTRAQADVPAREEVYNAPKTRAAPMPRAEADTGTDAEFRYDFGSDDPVVAEVVQSVEKKTPPKPAVLQEDLLEAEFKRLQKDAPTKPAAPAPIARPSASGALPAVDWRPVKPAQASEPSTNTISSTASDAERDAEFERLKRELKKRIEESDK